jgi:hypothetical protein
MYPTEEFLDPSLSGNSGEARLRAGEQIAAAEADGLTSMAGRHAKFGQRLKEFESDEATTENYKNAFAEYAKDLTKEAEGLYAGRELNNSGLSVDDYMKSIFSS